MPFLVPDPPPSTAVPLLSPRGARLATRVWRPASGNVRAICLLVHGAGWHSGYFEGLAGRLNREDIFVSAYDQVCMGYSDDEPDAPKGYIHVRDYSYFIEDMFAAVMWAKQLIPNSARIPFFLLGESFGGLQVLSAGLDKVLQQAHEVELAGVITLGAVLEIGPGILPPKPVIAMLKMMTICCPRLPMPATDTSSTFDEAFGNAEWAATARLDPKVQVSVKPTLAGAVSMIGNCEKVAAQANQFDIPLLAIHAIKDCRTVCQAMMQFVDRVGSRAEGLWLDSTTGHQLLQDRREVTEVVKNKVAEWIVLQCNLR